MNARATLGLVLLIGCHERDRPTAPPVEVRHADADADADANAHANANADVVYPWGPTAKGRLDIRYRAPAGFTRDATADGSFARFLRTLPLLPEGSPVVDYRGEPLYDEGRHPNIAGVVDLDVGTANLQHCADVVIRLDAEWRYGKGERNISYNAASRTPMPYRRYLAGEHAVGDGMGIVFSKRSAAPTDDHAFFRAYLDDVFAWANTRSLERDTTRVPKKELRAGDFFVVSGAPYGHSVLILDVARDANGRLALLLGQSYMPAQSFQVLRPNRDAAPWFVVEKDAAEVQTPFWKPFPMEALHRF